jgi:hypothetical protein
MTRSTRRKATLAGVGLTGAAGLLALALAGPGIALADPSPSPSGSASASAPANSDRAAKRAQQRDAYAEALAKELGIDKAKVLAALDKVDAAQAEQAKADRIAALKTRLDAAVADGKLTREQADAILKAAEAGVLNGPDGFGGRHGRGPGR